MEVFVLYSKPVSNTRSKYRFNGICGTRMYIFYYHCSISTALSMTYAGARGKTAYEMCLVLGFCPLSFNVHATYEALLGSLNSPQAQYTLALANGMFVNNNFNIYQSFTNLLATRYSAGFKLLDFNHDAAGSADYINQWVEQRTNNKIKDLVSAAGVQGSPLVLVNTIYFYGDWQCQFKKTRDTPFRVSNKKAIMVKMMSQTARFRYAVNHNLRCQILELPYDGCKVSMYIFLPMETEGLASLESKLTFNTVTAALAKLRKRRLSVGIPNFKIEKGIGLVPILRSMGIKRAFSAQNADFGGISANVPRIYVHDVIHKAFINVNETGTEAAAATAVIFFTTALMPPVKAQFLADHPFFFLLRDKTTGSILFLGRFVG